ncbi:hypothetical protein QN355_06325 [Cryobacterium sp. 10S3]|uniref:hypothetical protein n=1 Tax=Cryobacterium sp. 10S3 TaxID=3048582 RepID=UPI002AC8BBC0|nr:hypothetical protein [Cryobacterium sp. 10S3]MEB0286164.1 hypothetical protein [Cryobacterium sp. 10S3]WPX12222.1 hypothetical protein RHM57_11065 [Cryobacterium sp. 10S3]
MAAKSDVEVAAEVVPEVAAEVAEVVPEVAAEDVEPEPGLAEFVQRVQITGTRDGEKWPGIGRRVTLPIAEGRSYAALGYVTEA